MNSRGNKPTLNPLKWLRKWLPNSKTSPVTRGMFPVGALTGRLTLTERHEPVTKRREWHAHIKPHNGYRSKFEAEVAKQLDDAGVKYGYEVSRIHYGFNRFYVPDFTLYWPDGDEFYIEAKGWVDRKAHEKMRDVRFFNDRVDVRFVFQNGNTRVANLKSNVCQWASRMKFRWAVGEVPARWIAEGMKAVPEEAIP